MPDVVTDPPDPAEQDADVDLRLACSVSYPHLPHDGCDGRPHAYRVDHEIRTLRATVARLEGELAALRAGRFESAETALSREDWVCERLVAWVRDQERKPAALAFTAGGLRQVAYAVEDALAAAKAVAGREDDGLAVTEEWMRSIGAVRIWQANTNVGLSVGTLVLAASNNEMVLWDDPQGKCIGIRIVINPTRGHVRRLLNALALSPPGEARP